jgi:hypothetical protein
MQSADDIRKSVEKLCPKERDELLLSLLDLVTNPDKLIASIPELGEKLFFLRESKLTDHERYKRWVDCSCVVGNFNDDVTIFIQGLGRIDSKLVQIDRKQVDSYVNQTGMNALASIIYNDAIFLSRLWVFGGYELVRTLSAKPHNTLWSKDELANINRVKMIFSRIRMQLAKYEPQGKNHGKHHLGDYDIAQSILDTKLGTAWKINDNEWITRRSLADELLALFEALIQTRKSKS